ncbi:helix-turn-helix domain-containing protein [Microbacterium sp.]|uniref:helix-turn-helix domain-containing protein n=1 Tax=Microbacterium sp. TaxID=51671 RepID=UPI0039E244EC
MSPEKRAELVAAYQAGEPARTIAARFGAHRGTMPVFARPAGVPSREPGADADGRAHAAALYESGLTLAHVAHQMTVSVETVRAAVLADGGTIRPKGRMPRVTR